MKTIKGRKQEIKFTATGRPYINHRGTRWYLEEFMLTDSSDYDGFAHITNTSGVGIVIMDNNESARVDTIY